MREATKVLLLLLLDRKLPTTPKFSIMSLLRLKPARDRAERFPTLPTRWISLLFYWALLTGFCFNPLCAQTGDRSLSSFLYGTGGLRLYSATAYTGYNWFDIGSNNGLSRGSDIAFSELFLSGMADMGWSRSSERAHFGINYTPSYISLRRNDSYNSWNHRLTITGDRQLTRSWSFTGGILGAYTTMEQSLFAPTVFRQMTALPTTLDNLSNVLLRSPLTNEQMAATLTGSAIADSPARVLLFGNTALNTSANLSFSYAKSSRTIVSISAGGGHTRPIRTTQSENLPNNNLISDTTMGNANVTLSHSLSPRTQIGASVIGDRVKSNFQDVYRTSALFFAGRRMGMRWFAQLNGGLGTIRSVRQTYALPTGPQFQGAGSLMYRASSHSYLMSIQRSFGDQFGIAAGSTLSSSASWTWVPSRSNWQVFATGTDQRFGGRQPGNIRSWQANGGVSRRLGEHLSCTVEYAYLHYDGKQISSSIVQKGVRASLTWYPQRIAR